MASSKHKSCKAKRVLLQDLLNFSESSEDERNLADPLGKPISPAVQQGSDKYCSQLVGKENRKKSAVNTLKKEGGVNSEGHAKGERQSVKSRESDSRGKVSDVASQKDAARMLVEKGKKNGNAKPKPKTSVELHNMTLADLGISFDFSDNTDDEDEEKLQRERRGLKSKKNLGPQGTGRFKDNINRAGALQLQLQAPDKREDSAEERRKPSMHLVREVDGISKAQSSVDICGKNKLSASRNFRKPVSSADEKPSFDDLETKTSTSNPRRDKGNAAERTVTSVKSKTKPLKKLCASQGEKEGDNDMKLGKYCVPLPHPDVSVIRSAHSTNSVAVVVSPSEESLLPLSESTRLDCPETVQVSKKQSFGHLLAHDNSPCLFDSSLGDSQNSSYEQLKIVGKKEGEKLLIEETRAWNKKEPKTQGLEDAQTLSGLETSEGESQYMTCLATPDVSSMYEVVDISVQTSFNTGASAAADSDTAHATAVPADRPDDRPCSGGDLANSPEFCPDRGTEAAENAKVHCTTMVDLDKPQDRKPASMPVSARKEESCDVDHEPASSLDVWTHTGHSHEKDMKMEANAEHCKEDKEVKMEDIAEQCKEGKETICSKSHHSLEVRSKFSSVSNYFSESQSDVNTTSHGLGVVGNSHGTDGHKTQASLPQEVCSMNVGSSVTGEEDHTTAEQEGRTTHGTRQKSASPESSVFSSRQARRGTDKENVPGSSLRRSPKRHDDSSSEDDSDGRLEAFFQKMRTPAQPNQKVVKSNDLDEFIVNDSDITDSEENASDEDTDPMEGLCDDFLLESLASTRSAKGVFQAGQPQDTAVDDDVSSGSDDYDVLSDLDDDEDDCLQQLKTPRSKMMPSFSRSQTPREASPEWYTPATSMKTKQHRHRKHSPLDSPSSSVSSSTTTTTTGQGRADRGAGDWKTPASSVRPAANRPPSVKTLGFVPSLSSHIPDHLKDGEARSYIVHFKRKQEELSSRLFKLFNFTVFENQLSADLPVVWNKRLLKTAGLCKQKRVNDRYTAVIELSSKVCDTAERVRDTLVHEMCHAAVWILNKAKEGHGPHWKYWARKANRAHPEIPVIRRCHDYSINTKYIYKCEKCGYQIGRHSKSLDTELKVCGHCHGRFQLLPPSRAPSTSTSLSATPRTPAPFALFVKENYGSVKRGGGGLPHKAVMEALSREFAKTKINFS